MGDFALKESLQRIHTALKSGLGPLQITQLLGAGHADFCAQLSRSEKRPLLCLTPSTRDAEVLIKDLRFFLTREETIFLLSFPARDTLPYFRLPPHPEIMATRLSTLQTLLNHKNAAGPAPIIVAPLTALAFFIPKPSEMETFHIDLKVGEEIPRDFLISTLTDWGYQRETLVNRLGTFAVRGSVIDIFTALHESPLRLEFFDEQIESIRYFDPLTQKSTGPQPRSITLLPPREMLEESGGDEKHKSLFLDYLPQDTLWVMSEQDLSLERYHKFWSDLTRAYASTEEERQGPKPEEIAATPEQMATLLHENTKIKISSLTIDEPGVETISLGMEGHEGLRPEVNLTKKDAPLFESMAQWLKEHSLRESLYFLCPSESHRLRLRDLLEPYLQSSLINGSSLHEERLKDHRGQLVLLKGEISKGFYDPSQGLRFITEEEIFGTKIKRAQAAKPSKDSFSNFSEMEDGDLLVHKQHGIGLYRGLQTMTIGDRSSDFLLLEYRNKDKLYLPVDRLSLVQKYVGGDGALPPLDTLGGQSWQKTRDKARKAIAEIAGELLNLYAARLAHPGYAYPKADAYFEAFEASFPYEETLDQEKAIADVMGDMESPQAMDRLVLGDVGYGKTEVALRAVFKAAQQSKQSAILVPTTVLAFQHLETFKERFKETPVRVEMLSRFRSAAEQKEIKSKLKSGAVDVIIGTHALLQPNISLKDLGLLVIDEEHRFGVAAKEKIKRLKKNVDVLSLSATPIPRTLYMSFVGMRPISVIETPPVDRLSIRTFVTPLSEAIIKEAVLRELRRGGQVYFVHNRIATIEALKNHLQRIIPEARIGVGHGGMDEDELEKVMHDFMEKRFDVLLCTTIIESGIDIPNANTILINRADRLGLAQLYQLRGRVGRSSHQAYAYLLLAPRSGSFSDYWRDTDGVPVLPEERDPFSGLTKNAKKRLAILKKFSELGSGFKMAQHDLEIRGAGNLLGTKQSGHMTALGYELYTELLEKAVSELKGEDVLEQIDPEVLFPIAALLPQDYIPDAPLRLDLYRRLSSAGSEAEVEALYEEMIDRFGSLPPEARNFVSIASIKTLAKRLRIRELKDDKTKLSLQFDESSPLPPQAVLNLLKTHPKKFRLSPEQKLTMIHEPTSPEGLLKLTNKFLSDLIGTC